MEIMRCIDDKRTKGHLKAGSPYSILAENGFGDVQVRTERGELRYYAKSRFQPIVQTSSKEDVSKLGNVICVKNTSSEYANKFKVGKVETIEWAKGNYSYFRDGNFIDQNGELVGRENSIQFKKTRLGLPATKENVKPGDVIWRPDGSKVIGTEFNALLIVSIHDSFVNFIPFSVGEQAAVELDPNAHPRWEPNWSSNWTIIDTEEDREEGEDQVEEVWWVL